jgi:[protein-PII] uridylyltransferase
VKIRPRVSFKDDASDAATLIEIVSEDRPGLLYDLANAISLAGCNIEVVMIDTEAHKALDVFYVTHQGHKLGDELQSELKSELLAACIGPR